MDDYNNGLAVTQDAPVLDPQLTGGTFQASPTSNAGSQPLAVPPQHHVDDFLRKKRKAREHKACYPCRQRKVKCDLSRPCQTCRDREHPELCSYHPPNKRQSTDSGPVLTVEDHVATNPTSHVMTRGDFDAIFQKLNAMESSITELRRELHRNYDARRPSTATQNHARPDSSSPAQTNRTARHHADVHGIHTRNDAGEIVHFGAGSVPAMLYVLGQSKSGPSQPMPYEGHYDFNGPSSTQHQLQEVLGKSVLPLFALDNESMTYPFVDLWGLPHGSLQRAHELARALPGDEELMIHWHSYRNLGHVVYPAVPDAAAFEDSLRGFLANRAARRSEMDGVTEDMIWGRSYCWLGLLYAVLASGAQCGSMPRKERELTSQVYVCCAFECLRFTNFLSQPHTESIQTLLVIGMVLANNLNAGSAWSLLGLTIRLAQGLGLHRNCPPNVPTDVVFPRSRVWWAIVWQDSLLSITYDRGSSTATIDCSTMPMPHALVPMPQKLGNVIGYHASMYRLCKLGLEIVRDRSRAMDTHEHYAFIIQYREAIWAINREAADYIRDPQKCTNKQQALEHFGFSVHSAYALSELYRPAISQSSEETELSHAFRQPCVDALCDVVEGYMGLQGASTIAHKAWAAIHRALSSALLLGIMGEHSRNERANRLLRRYMAVMVDNPDSIDPSEAAGPMQRGIAALKKLNIAMPPSTSPKGPHALVNGTGLPHAERACVITPTTTENGVVSSSGEDNSPYSMVNSILWGSANADFRGNPETFVV